MKIDWFTFAAQIINFLILVALLKRFLYGPILKAIADREAEIAARFEQAQQQQTTAAAAQQNFETRTAELAHAKQQLLADAADEVDRWKRERLEEARTEVTTSRADWFSALERERSQLRDDLLQQYQRDGLRLAEGVLKCLATPDVEQLMVDSFVSHVRSADLSHAVSSPGEPVTVRSAFDLTESQEQQLRDALQSHGFAASDVQFRVDESLICGLEIRTSDHEIAWNARESLDFLTSEFGRDVDQTLAPPDSLSQSTEASHVS